MIRTINETTNDLIAGALLRGNETGLYKGATPVVSLYVPKHARQIAIRSMEGGRYTQEWARKVHATGFEC